jgi:outer membrane murein-binding lipoprotein Lpp
LVAVIRWALIAALGAALALAGLLVREMRATGRLAAENLRLSASVEALERKIEADRIAVAIARDIQKRERARAARYDRLRGALMAGGHDEPIPDWFRDYQHRLGFDGLQPAAD